MSVQIRTANSDDLAVIVQFNMALALETENTHLAPEVITPGVAKALADARRGQYFLAVDGSQVVGQTLITYEWSDWRNGWIWWIQSVYVRADYRGRGVFRQIYQYIHALAQIEPEVVGIRLYVEENNTTAQQIYTRLGMRPGGYLVYERCPL